MDKTHKAIACLIAQNHIKSPDGIYKILSDLMINDLFSLMGDTCNIDKVNSEKWHLKSVLHDLAYLMSHGIVEHRHAKQILQAAWDMEPYAWDICWYLSDSKLLNEQDGNTLDIAIKKILDENKQVVIDIQCGKTKAVGSLIGKVLKAVDGKADPKLISKRIIELVELPIEA